MATPMQRFIEGTYLRQEAEESIEVKPEGSGFDIDKAIQRTIRLSNDRHQMAFKALRREIERRGLTLPYYWQPFTNAVVLKDGAPWEGNFWCRGNYYPDEASVARARRIALDRDYADALREDAYRLRHAVRMAHSQAIIEDQERERLRRELVASVAAYEVTPAGRAALVETP